MLLNCPPNDVGKSCLHTQHQLPSHQAVLGCHSCRYHAAELSVGLKKPAVKQQKRQRAPTMRQHKVLTAAQHSNGAPQAGITGSCEEALHWLEARFSSTYCVLQEETYST